MQTTLILHKNRWRGNYHILLQYHFAGRSITGAGVVLVKHFLDDLCNVHALTKNYKVVYQVTTSRTGTGEKVNLLPFLLPVAVTKSV
jgi:ligand-binding SRPBCC domain-containing protein